MNVNYLSKDTINPKAFPIGKMRFGLSGFGTPVVAKGELFSEGRWVCYSDLS